MELLISKKIYQYRKQKDITQDELAAAIGVSPQAVSNWERGGYPDITLLPALANFFGISIDELMGNDELGQKEDKELFIAAYNNADNDRDQLELAKNYYRKYPNVPTYMNRILICSVNLFASGQATQEDLLPLAKEVSEKMLNYPKFREYAISYMTILCPEADLGEWLDMSAITPYYTRRSNLISRYQYRGEHKKAAIQQSILRLEQFSVFTDSRFPDADGPEKKAEFHRNVLALLDTLRVNGKLPDGWVHIYAYKLLVMSACLFGCGRSDEGWTAFAQGMEMMKTWFTFPEDAILELGGGELFGGLKVKKNWYYVITPEGNEEVLLDCITLFFFTPDRLLDFLTDPRWAWFDSARSDPRFTEAVNWARSLTEKAE